MRIIQLQHRTCIGLIYSKYVVWIHSFCQWFSLQYLTDSLRLSFASYFLRSTSTILFIMFWLIALIRYILHFIIPLWYRCCTISDGTLLPRITWKWAAWIDRYERLILIAWNWPTWIVLWYVATWSSFRVCYWLIGIISSRRYIGSLAIMIS